MPGQPAREHRLAGAGRADEQQVVAAGRRDLQRPPRRPPARARRPDPARCQSRGGGAGVGRRRRAASPPARRAAGRPARPGAAAPATSQPADRPPPRAAFSGGTTRRRTPWRARPGGDRQHAAHRAQRAVERQLADEQRVRPAPPDRRGRPPHSMPTAIGTSKAAPSLRRSAGARLTVIRRGGSLKPLFSSAPRMRTRPSLHAGVGKPDDVAAGQPERRRRPRRRSATPRFRPRRRRRRARACVDRSKRERCQRGAAIRRGRAARAGRLLAAVSCIRPVQTRSRNLLIVVPH